MKQLQYVKSKLKEWNKASFRDLKERKKKFVEDTVIIEGCE